MTNSHRTYDVAVIGLGAIGSAALYQLSKLGLNVVGIDKYAPPHSHGSSYGESRVTRQAIGEGDFYTPLVLRSNEIWAELEKASGEQLFDRNGMLIAAYDENIWFQNTLKAAKDFSITHRIFDGKEAERLFPALKVAQKDNVFYYEPTSGYLHPETCVEVQLKLAGDNGATTLLNTEIQKITEQADGVELQLQDNTIISARKVIVASGPWISELLPDVLSPILKTYLHTIYWFDIDRAHYAELSSANMPVFLCGFEKQPRTKAFSGFPALAGKDGGIKFSMDEEDTEIDPDNKDATPPKAGVAEELYEHVSSYVKHVKPSILRSFNCVYTATPDWDFILDFVPGSERIIVASACSSHGFKHSAAVGEILAELATDGKTTLDISPFKIRRFL